MLSFKQIEPLFHPTGCKQCNYLRKETNGKIQWCLVHDETLDPAWREAVRVRFETLVVGDHRKKDKDVESNVTE